MAFARDVYTATASQTDFTITYSYQAEEDVTVYQNGSLVSTDDYTFPNATTVRLDTGATEDDKIVLERSTSRSARDVDFTAGPLTESDLDNANIQVFYMAQEALDRAGIALSKDSSEIWDAESIRIQNVATPTADGDAARKDYVDSEIASAALGTLGTPLSVANGGTAGATKPAARASLAVPGVTTQATAADADDDDTAGYTVGDVIVDTTADKAYIALDVTDEAAVWKECSLTDNAVTLAMLEHGTSGDVLYYGASGTPTRLAKGTDGQVLTLASGVPSWAGGGSVAQVVEASNNTEMTTTTTMPADDTIPQNTEGAEVVTVAITPTNSSSTLYIDMVAYVAAANSSSVSMALFVDTTADALEASTENPVSGGAFMLALNAVVSAGSTSARTYKMRVGSASATALGIIGTQAGGGLFNGKSVARIRVIEVLP